VFNPPLILSLLSFLVSDHFSKLKSLLVEDSNSALDATLDILLNEIQPPLSLNFLFQIFLSFFLFFFKIFNFFFDCIRSRLIDFRDFRFLFLIQKANIDSEACFLVLCSQANVNIHSTLLLYYET